MQTKKVKFFTADSFIQESVCVCVCGEGGGGLDPWSAVSFFLHSVSDRNSLISIYDRA